MYKTVLNEATAEIIEKNSRFIASVKPVTTKEEAEAFIEEIRAKNRTANHNVYAYVLRENNYQKHSDDGEPGGTAGMPVLNVLLKQELTDAVIVVQDILAEFCSERADLCARILHLRRLEFLTPRQFQCANILYLK